MKRLYRVEVTGRMYVLAEDDREAAAEVAVCIDNVAAELAFDGRLVEETTVVSEEDRALVPVNDEGDEERTVGQLHDEIKAAAEVERRQGKLPFGGVG